MRATLRLRPPAVNKACARVRIGGATSFAPVLITPTGNQWAAEEISTIAHAYSGVGGGVGATSAAAAAKR